MVRKAPGEVVGVVLRELGEGARLGAADPAYGVGHRLPLALAVGGGYEGELVGAPPGQAALGDEGAAKGLRLRRFVHNLLPDGRADRLGCVAVRERLRAAHDVGRPRVPFLHQRSRSHARDVAQVQEGEPAGAHRCREPPLRCDGGTEDQEVLHVELRAEDGVRQPRLCESPLGPGVPAHEPDRVVGPCAAGRELDDPPHAGPGGSLHERAFHFRLHRVVPRHEERAVHAVQRPRQGLGALEVRDRRLHAPGGEADGLLLRPHHRARLGASADQFLDERAADLAAGPRDEDGAQGPNVPRHHSVGTPLWATTWLSTRQPSPSGLMCSLDTGHLTLWVARAYARAGTAYPGRVPAAPVPHAAYASRPLTTIPTPSRVTTAAPTSGSSRCQGLPGLPSRSNPDLQRTSSMSIAMSTAARARPPGSSAEARFVVIVPPAGIVHATRAPPGSRRTAPSPV